MFLRGEGQKYWWESHPAGVWVLQKKDSYGLLDAVTDSDPQSTFADSSNPTIWKSLLNLLPKLAGFNYGTGEGNVRAGMAVKFYGGV